MDAGWRRSGEVAGHGEGRTVLQSEQHQALAEGTWHRALATSTSSGIEYRMHEGNIMQLILCANQSMVDSSVHYDVALAEVQE